MENIFQPKIPWYAYPLFLQNLFPTFTENQSLGGASLGVTWSLALEEQFYVTLPLLIWFLRKRVRALALAVVFLIFLAPVVRVLLLAWISGSGGALATHIYMPARLDDLGLGVLGAMAMRSESWRSTLSRSWLLPAIAAICTVDLLFPNLLMALPLGTEVATLLPNRLAVVFACLLLMAVLFRHSRWSKFLRLRPRLITGTISYLIHFPVLWIAMRVMLNKDIHSFDSV